MRSGRRGSIHLASKRPNRGFCERRRGPKVGLEEVSPGKLTGPLSDGESIGGIAGYDATPADHAIGATVAALREVIGAIGPSPDCLLSWHDR